MPRILIADNEPKHYQYMKSVIERDVVGASCVPATSIKEVHEVLAGSRIDCIVLDDYFADPQSRREEESPQADQLMVDYEKKEFPIVIVSWRPPTRHMLKLNPTRPFFRLQKPDSLRRTDDNKKMLDTFDMTLSGVVTNALHCRTLAADLRGLSHQQVPVKEREWRIWAKRILWWFSGVTVGAIAGKWILRFISQLVS